MDSYKELAQRLRSIQTQSVSLLQGIVKSIEGTSCTVEIAGLDIPDVRLRATLADTEAELLITPAVGSGVIVGSLSGDLTQLVVLSVDRADTITLHSGRQGGLVLVEPLVTRLNALEQDLNALKQVLGSWQAVPNDGGKALQLLLTSWAKQSLTQTQASDLENKQIKQ